MRVNISWELKENDGRPWIFIKEKDQWFTAQEPPKAILEKAKCIKEEAALFPIE